MTSPLASLELGDFDVHIRGAIGDHVLCHIADHAWVWAEPAPLAYDLLALPAPASIESPDLRNTS